MKINVTLMGKFFAVLLLFALAFSVVPGLAYAQEGTQGQPCRTATPFCDAGLSCESNLCVGEQLPKAFDDLGGLIGFIERMLNIVFAVLLIFVVIMLVWGSLEFVTSAGDETKVSAARQKMLYAVIGLVLALVAAGIPPLVRSIVGV